jgi:hypothetical protein
MSSGVRQRFDPEMRNAGGLDTERGDETSKSRINRDLVVPMCALVRVGGRALIEPDADQVKVLALSFFGELYFLSR